LTSAVLANYLVALAFGAKLTIEQVGICSMLNNKTRGRRMKKQLMTALVIAGVTCLGNAYADVVVNANVTWSSGQPSYMGQYSATVCQTAQTADCDYTSVWFNKVNSTLTPTTWNVDEEADFYLAPNGVEFSAATIASGQFSPLFVLDNAYSINIPYGTFYLGVNTGTGFTYDENGYGGPGREVFGWMQLHNSSAGLQMISNAMAYGTNGIFIGTTDVVPVPEPEAYAMMLAGLWLVGFMVRRRKQVET
jgi:hypothetical protein